MISFAVLAAVLALASVLAVTLPLLRRAKEGAPPAPWAALVAGGMLLVGSALLYLTWSHWSWRSAPAPDSPQTMVARLARELEAKPDNLEGWLMLGRSYVVLQELPLALRAFERAERLSGGKNVDALLGEAEVLALEDPAELKGRAGRLIDRALELAPDSGKVLFFGATVAATRGELPLARERFARILAMNPPDNVRPILEQQIRYIDERLAAAPAASAAGQPETGADAAAAVRVNITLAPGVTGANTAPLFVFVRTAGAPGGPPLAAKRLESHFPQSVTLTSADSMIPGRSFATGQAVQVVARIARSGSPVGASGDPYGEIIYRVGEDGQLNLVIDRLTP
jgi:cytochrome c-type biogenesis protein CcmH